MGDDWREFIDEAYDEEGVWVTVPRQANGRLVRIERKTLPEDTPGTPTVFEPKDIRINFQVWEQLDGGSSQILQKLNPPMVLRVAITDKARDWAAQSGQLRLAFWDGSEWVLFTKRKHLFHLTPNHGIAVIRDWGDPAVAWG
jgi:hypothetical protein